MKTKILTRDDWFSCSDIYPEIRSNYIFNIHGDVKNIVTNTLLDTKVKLSNTICRIGRVCFSILRGIYILLKTGKISIEQIPKNHHQYLLIKNINLFLSIDEKDKIRILDIPDLENYIGKEQTDYLNRHSDRIDIYIDKNCNVWNKCIFPCMYLNKLNYNRLGLSVASDGCNFTYISLKSIYASLFSKPYTECAQLRIERNEIIIKLHSEGVSYKNISNLLGNVVSTEGIRTILHRNKKINKTN